MTDFIVLKPDGNRAVAPQIFNNSEAGNPQIPAVLRNVYEKLKGSTAISAADRQVLEESFTAIWNLDAGAKDLKEYFTTVWDTVVYPNLLKNSMHEDIQVLCAYLLNRSIAKKKLPLETRLLLCMTYADKCIVQQDYAAGREALVNIQRILELTPNPITREVASLNSIRNPELANNPPDDRYAIQLTYQILDLFTDSALIELASDTHSTDPTVLAVRALLPLKKTPFLEVQLLTALYRKGIYVRGTGQQTLDYLVQRTADYLGVSAKDPARALQSIAAAGRRENLETRTGLTRASLANTAVELCMLENLQQGKFIAARQLCQDSYREIVPGEKDMLLMNVALTEYRKTAAQSAWAELEKYFRTETFDLRSAAAPEEEYVNQQKVNGETTEAALAKRMTASLRYQAAIRKQLLRAAFAIQRKQYDFAQTLLSKYTEYPLGYQREMQLELLETINAKRIALLKQYLPVAPELQNQFNDLLRRFTATYETSFTPQDKFRLFWLDFAYASETNDFVSLKAACDKLLDAQLNLQQTYADLEIADQKDLALSALSGMITYYTDRNNPARDPAQAKQYLTALTQAIDVTYKGQVLLKDKVTYLWAQIAYADALKDTEGLYALYRSIVDEKTGALRVPYDQFGGDEALKLQLNAYAGLYEYYSNPQNEAADEQTARSIYQTLTAMPAVAPLLSDYQTTQGIAAIDPKTACRLLFVIAKNTDNPLPIYDHLATLKLSAQQKREVAFGRYEYALQQYAFVTGPVEKEELQKSLLVLQAVPELQGLTEPEDRIRLLSGRLNYAVASEDYTTADTLIEEILVNSENLPPIAATYRRKIHADMLATRAELTADQNNPQYNLTKAASYVDSALLLLKPPYTTRMQLLVARFENDPEKRLALYTTVQKELRADKKTTGTYQYATYPSRNYWYAVTGALSAAAEAQKYDQYDVLFTELETQAAVVPSPLDQSFVTELYANALVEKADLLVRRGLLASADTTMLQAQAAMARVALPRARELLSQQLLAVRIARAASTDHLQNETDLTAVDIYIYPLLTETTLSVSVLLHDYAVLQKAQLAAAAQNDYAYKNDLLFLDEPKTVAAALKTIAKQNISPFGVRLLLQCLLLAAKLERTGTLTVTGDDDPYEQLLETLPVADFAALIGPRFVTELSPRKSLDYAWGILDGDTVNQNACIIAAQIAQNLLADSVTTADQKQEAAELLMLSYAKNETDRLQQKQAYDYYAATVAALKGTPPAKLSVSDRKRLLAALDNLLYLQPYVFGEQDAQEFSKALTILKDPQLQWIFIDGQTNRPRPQYAKVIYFCNKKLGKPQDNVDVLTAYSFYVQGASPKQATAALDLLLMYVQDQVETNRIKIPAALPDLVALSKSAPNIPDVYKKYIEYSQRELQVQLAVNVGDYVLAKNQIEFTLEPQYRGRKNPPMLVVEDQQNLLRSVLFATEGKYTEALTALQARQTADYAFAYALQNAWINVKQYKHTEAQALLNADPLKAYVPQGDWVWNTQESVEYNKRRHDVALLAAAAANTVEAKVKQYTAITKAVLPPEQSDVRNRYVADAYLQLAKINYYEKQPYDKKQAQSAFTAVQGKDGYFTTQEQHNDYAVLAIVFNEQTPAEKIAALTGLLQKVQQLGITYIPYRQQALNIITAVDNYLSDPAAVGNKQQLSEDFLKAIPVALHETAAYQNYIAHRALERGDWKIAQAAFEKIRTIAKRDDASPVDKFWAKVNLGSVYRMLGQTDKLQELKFTDTDNEKPSDIKDDPDWLTYPALIAADIDIVAARYAENAYETAGDTLLAILKKLPKGTAQANLIAAKIIDFYYESKAVGKLEQLIKDNPNTEIANRAAVALMKLAVSDKNIVAATAAKAKYVEKLITDPPVDPTVEIEYQLQAAALHGLTYKFSDRLTALSVAAGRILGLLETTAESKQSKAAYQKLVDLLYAYHYLEGREYAEFEKSLGKIKQPTAYPVQDKAYELQAAVLTVEYALARADYPVAQKELAALQEKIKNLSAEKREGLATAIGRAQVKLKMLTEQLQEKQFSNQEPIRTNVNIPLAQSGKTTEQTDSLLTPSDRRSLEKEKAEALAQKYVPEETFDWTKLPEKYKTKNDEFNAAQGFWNKKQAFDAMLDTAIELGLYDEVEKAINILYFSASAATGKDDNSLPALAKTLRTMLPQGFAFNPTEQGYALFTLMNKEVNKALDATAARDALLTKDASGLSLIDRVLKNYGVTTFKDFPEGKIDEPLKLLRQLLAENSTDKVSLTDLLPGIMSLEFKTDTDKTQYAYIDMYRSYTSPDMLAASDYDKYKATQKIIAALAQPEAIAAIKDREKPSVEALLLEMKKNLLGFAAAKNTGAYAKDMQAIDAILDKLGVSVLGNYRVAKGLTLDQAQAYFEAQSRIDRQADSFTSPQIAVQRLIGSLGDGKYAQPLRQARFAEYVRPASAKERSAHADVIAQIAQWYTVLYRETGDKDYRELAESFAGLLPKIYPTYNNQYIFDALNNVHQHWIGLTAFGQAAFDGSMTTTYGYKTDDGQEYKDNKNIQELDSAFKVGPQVTYDALLQDKRLKFGLNLGGLYAKQEGVFARERTNESDTSGVLPTDDSNEIYGATFGGYLSWDARSKYNPGMSRTLTTNWLNIGLNFNATLNQADRPFGALNETGKWDKQLEQEYKLGLMLENSLSPVHHPEFSFGGKLGLSGSQKVEAQQVTEEKIDTETGDKTTQEGVVQLSTTTGAIDLGLAGQWRTSVAGLPLTLGASVGGGYEFAAKQQALETGSLKIQTFKWNAGLNVSLQPLDNLSISLFGAASGIFDPFSGEFDEAIRDDHETQTMTPQLSAGLNVYALLTPRTMLNISAGVQGETTQKTTQTKETGSSLTEIDSGTTYYFTASLKFKL